jgi:hypothetical protein
VFDRITRTKAGGVEVELGPLDSKVVGIVAESVEEQETKAVPLARFQT